MFLNVGCTASVHDPLSCTTSVQSVHDPITLRNDVIESATAEFELRTPDQESSFYL